MVTIHVCIGSACHLKGSYNVIKELQKNIDQLELNDKVEIKGSFCLGQCTNAVSVKINDGVTLSLNAKSVPEFLKNNVLCKL